MFRKLCTSKSIKQDVRKLKPQLEWTYHSLKASSSNISKLAPRCTAPADFADEFTMVKVPSDWVKLFSTKMAPAAEQMLWLSRWSKKKNTAPLGKWIRSHHSRHINSDSSVQRSDCLQHLLQKICRKKSLSKQIHQTGCKMDVSNLETTTKMNLPQPQSQLKQHLETLPKALQGAPRLRPALPMNLRWSKCHRTGRSCSSRKWLLRPSKCCGFLPQRLENLHSYSIKIIRIGKYCSTWQVHWKSKVPAWYQHRLFRAAIWLIAISSLKDLYKESLSKQSKDIKCT